MYGKQRWLQFVGGLFQPPPLSNVLQADYVVVATPVQYAGAEACGQDMRVLVDAFAAGTGIAGDFSRLPAQFLLSEGDGYPQGGKSNVATQVRVDVYRRQRVTGTETALAAFQRTRALAGGCPIGEPDWIILSQAPTWAYIDRYNRYEFRAERADGQDATAVFAYTPPAWGDTLLHGRLESTGSGCTLASIGLLRTDQQSRFAAYATLDVDDQGRFSTPVAPETGSDGTILLQVTRRGDMNEAMPACPTRIELSKSAESGTTWGRLTGRVVDGVRSRIRLTR